MQRVELHCHTTFSDGALSPTELMLRAQQMQIDVLAITDHDNVLAFDEALAARQSHNINIELMTGIEVSTQWHGFEIHVLGYGFDRHAPQIQTLQREQTLRRQQRFERICEKLSFLQIDDLSSLVKERVKGAYSRAHIADVLVEQGVCQHRQQAFDKFLGKGKRAYVKPEWPTLEAAIETIQECGGKASLAHPHHYDMKAKWLRRLIESFANANGDAIEIANTNIPPTKRELIIDLTKSSNLRMSVGSDFHAPSRWQELGRIGKVTTELEPVWTGLATQ